MPLSKALDEGTRMSIPESSNSDSFVNTSLPQKSSKQILDELFSSLNVDPPTSCSDYETDGNKTATESDTSSGRKKNKKKKHKHKKSKNENKLRKEKQRHKRKSNKSKIEKITDIEIRSGNGSASTKEGEKQLTNVPTNNETASCNYPEHDCSEAGNLASRNSVDDIDLVNSDEMLINKVKSFTPIDKKDNENHSNSTDVSGDVRSDDVAVDEMNSPEGTKPDDHHRSTSRNRSGSRRQQSSSRKRSSSCRRKSAYRDDKKKHDSSECAVKVKDRSCSKSKYRSRSRSKNKYRSRSRSKNKYRSRSRSKNKYRSRSRSKNRRRSRSASKSCYRSRNRSKKRSRSRSNRKRSNSRLRSRRSSRSRSPRKVRHRTRSKTRYRCRTSSKDRFRSRSRDYRKRKERNHSRSVSRHQRYRRSLKRSISRTRRSGPSNRSPSINGSDPPKIDKQKLFEIARKNAISMSEQGSLPESVVPITDDKIALINSGGRTVDELTNFCKQLSKKETVNPITSSSSDNDYRYGDINRKGNISDDDVDKIFHHPFQIKDRPSNIVMNIRNSVALPTKTAQEKTTELSKHLRLQFPVSSGSQHRSKQSEWVDVDKTASSYGSNHSNSNSHSSPFNNHANESIEMSINMEGFNVSSAIACRLEALRQLEQNPNNPEANATVRQIDQQLKLWAESKQELGKFTGSTDARILTPAELSAGPQAWVMKHQLKSASPITSGFGLKLMQKMGWRPGQGLGKYEQGPIAPFEVDIKVDKRGLISQSDVSTPSLPRGAKLSSVKVITMPNTATAGTMNTDNFCLTTPKTTNEVQSKHPVSLLNEYCSRKKLGPPIYSFEEIIQNDRRQFTAKVFVQGTEYVAAASCHNKKQGKYDVAVVCLQHLGIFPTTAKLTSV